MRDMSVSEEHAAAVGTGVSAVLAVPLLVLFLTLWGVDRLEAGVMAQLRSLGRLAAVLVASIPAHELLHALGWVWAGKQPWSAVRFGVMWKSLMPYAHLKVPVAAGPYRVGIVLPGVVLGFLPALAGVAVGNGAWLCYGLIMIFVAAGDWVIFGLSLRIPRDQLVQDPPRG